MRIRCCLPLYLVLALAGPVALADDFDAPAWRRFDAPQASNLALGNTLSTPRREGRPSPERQATAKPAEALNARQRFAMLKLERLRRQYGQQSPVDTDRIVARAHELIGTPYRWGGESEKAGFDCSGLLVYLYSSIAKRQLPRTTGLMIAQQRNLVDQGDLQPGDAVFFNHNGRGRTNHVGLYIGAGRFIHAPSTGKTIRIDSLDNSYWQRRYTTARRFSG